MNFFSAGGDLGGKTRKTLSRYNFACVLVVSLGSICFGYTANVFNTTLGQSSFLEYWDLFPGGRSNYADLLAVTNGIFEAGGVVGALALPSLSDRWGRKIGLASSAILCLVSGAFLAGSTNYGEFLFFRFVAGAGAFMCLAAVPIWMSEVSSPCLRGALVQIHGISLVLGYAGASWIGYFIYYWRSRSLAEWRLPLAVQCLPPICLLCGLYVIPESPRWLVMTGEPEKAKTILMHLHYDSSDPHNTFARKEFLQICKQADIDCEQPRGYNNIFRDRFHLKRALFTIGTTSIVRFSGALAIGNYGPMLFTNLGFSTNEKLIYAAAWFTFALGTNAIACLMNDKFPRNKLLSIGVIGCMILLSIITALTATYFPTNTASPLLAIIGMYFVFQIPYGGCLNGLQFIYISELWPTHLRAKGVSLGVATIALVNIAYMQSAPAAITNIGWKYYLAFIVPGVIGSVLVWSYFPDTKGVPLEQVPAVLGERDGIALSLQDIDVNAVTTSPPAESKSGHMVDSRKDSPTRDESSESQSEIRTSDERM